MRLCKSINLSSSIVVDGPINTVGKPLSVMVGAIPDSSAASFVDKVLGDATSGMLQAGEHFHPRASAIEIAKTLSPRILRRTLREAATYAYLAERTVLYEDDSLKALDGPSNAGRKRFGFA
jgi:hypothetical protein